MRLDGNLGLVETTEDNRIYILKLASEMNLGVYQETWKLYITFIVMLQFWLYNPGSIFINKPYKKEKDVFMLTTMATVFNHAGFFLMLAWWFLLYVEL